MNNLKLITTHPDYWLLVDTETYLCDKTIAYRAKHPDAPALEGVLQLPELPKQEEASSEFIDEALDILYLNGSKEDGKYMLTLTEATTAVKEIYRAALQPISPIPTPVGFEPEELEEDDAIVSLALHGHWFKTTDNILQGRWLYAK